VLWNDCQVRACVLRLWVGRLTVPIFGNGARREERETDGRWAVEVRCGWKQRNCRGFLRYPHSMNGTILPDL
jgi:hypothetical protein